MPMPPVTPRRMPAPPWNPLKTGKPTAPRKRYSPMERKPQRPPSRLKIKKIAKVCFVKLICSTGTQIQAQIVIRAAEMAQ